MWTHHFRHALRTLVRDKGTVALGGLSLAVAIAACILITLFVRDELSYDRALPNADRISAIAHEGEFGGERDARLTTPYVLSDEIVDKVAGTEAATTTLRTGEADVLDGAGATVDVLYADSLFFDVVALAAVAGDPQAAFHAPGQSVLTVSAARRLFGGAAAAVGRDLSVVARGDTVTATVGAVVADLPRRSNLDFELVLPVSSYIANNSWVDLDWGVNMWGTYVLRQAGTRQAAFQRSLDALAAEHRREDEIMNLLDVPLLDFRLSEFSQADGFGGDPVLLRLFGAVALLILVLGAINYVNLATARGARRAREIGVRKALGSGRGALVRQFLTESVVLAALAAAIGLALAALALPFFNTTFGTDLALSDLDPTFLAGLLGAALVVGVLAGLYPALYLSAFEPLRVLRGAAAPAQAAGDAFLARTWLRRGLVVFQFAAVVLLIAGTASVARQLHFVQTTPLGFEPEGVAVVDVEGALSEQTEAVKAAFQRSPNVVAAAGAQGVPPKIYMAMQDHPDADQPDRFIAYDVIDADADYAEAIGLTVAAGRWPNAENADDMARGVVVNEAFVEALGWPSAESAVGREIRGKNVIVGVVKDFHFDSLRDPIGAVLLGPKRVSDFERETFGITGPTYGEVIVRFAPGQEAEGLADVRAAWADLAPGTEFTSRWVEDDLADLYEEEARLARTFGLFAGIAVLIAMLGLVGLATYTAERRTKEVGIRKVLGASVGGLVGLLSREYLALVALAAVLVAPVTVILVRRWLEGFAYHAPFSPLVLVGAAVGALVLALVSVGVQALRAATADPVRALRSE